MMDEKWVDILQLEHDIYERASGIADALYVTQNPAAVPDKQSSYIVMAIGGTVSNEGAYKRSYGHFYLYVRNKVSGVQDSVKIDDLSNKLLALFPMVSDYYSGISPSVSYGARVGEFTRIIIRFELRIKN